MIDVLKYTRKLEEAGFEREQAELFVRGQVSMISDNVATKADLDMMATELRSEMKELGTELRSEMKELGTELRSEMKELGTELRSEMKEKFTKMSEQFAKMETSLVVKIFVLMGIQLTILGGLAKVFF